MDAKMVEMGPKEAISLAEKLDIGLKPPRHV